MLLCFWHALTSGQVQALPRQQSFSSTVPSEDVEPPTKEQLHRHSAKYGYKHVDGHAIMHKVLQIFSQRVSGFVKSLNHHQKSSRFSSMIFALQVPPSSGSAFHWVPACFGSCTEAHQTYASRWNPKRRFGFLDNFLMIVFGDLIDSTLCVTWPARKVSEHHRKLNEREAMVVKRNSEMPDQSDALIYASVFCQRWESRSFKLEVALNFSTMAAQRSQGFLL